MSVGPEVVNSQPSVEGSPRINIETFMKDFRAGTHFREIDEDLVLLEDPVGLQRVLPDGSKEIYMDKTAQERAKARNEAVSWGVGRIGNNRVVEIVFNWEFMLGSSGIIPGEKFIRAMHFATAATSKATTENLPMIMVCASSGQRQQEAVPGLREMLRTVYALKEFKKKTNQPLIAVLVGNVWGGLTASAVPMADIIIGMEGTNFGFAGPRPIKEFEGIEPSPGSQTVEKSFATNRVVHVILNDQTQLLPYLDKILKLVSSEGQAPQKPKRHKEISGIDFSRQGYHVPLRPKRVIRSHPRTEVPMVFRPSPTLNTIWKQHQALRGDLRRPDTVYLLQHAFDGFVPIFSGRVHSEPVANFPMGTEHLWYPSIVAALAYIDDPRLQKRLVRTVIGNQQSYHRQPNGKIISDYAYPTAWDYRHELDMIEVAKRYKFQITTFVNTLGARPTLKDEEDAQYQAISSCLEAQLEYPYFTSGYLIGIGGSGGHLATDFTADYAAMLSGAQEFVAVPEAAATILYPKGFTNEDKIRTAEGMKPTASDIFEMGLVDKIVKEPQGGAQNHPLVMALAIREDIIQVELDYGELSSEDILQRRKLRMERLHPVIGHLSGKPLDRSRLSWERFLRR